MDHLNIASSRRGAYRHPRPLRVIGPRRCTAATASPPTPASRCSASCKTATSSLPKPRWWLYPPSRVLAAEFKTAVLRTVGASRLHGSLMVTVSLRMIMGLVRCLAVMREVDVGASPHTPFSFFLSPAEGSFLSCGGLLGVVLELRPAWGNRPHLGLCYNTIQFATDATSRNRTTRNP